MYISKGQRKDSQLEALFSKCSKKVWSGAYLRCWLEETVNGHGSVSFPGRHLREGLESSYRHGLMLPKAVLEFGHLLVQRFGQSL